MTVAPLFANPGFERVTQPPAAWGYPEVAAHISARAPRLTAPTDRPIEVLEAGGGSASHMPLPSNARITTIDISPEQLARNTYAAETLLGDLQTFDYGTRTFDVVIAWDVMEHVPDPVAALDRLVSILRPEGQIIIVGPLPGSFKGLMKSLTPHLLHVAFYRHVLGSTTAGQPGHVPFPVAHSKGSDPRQMADQLRSRGLQVRSLVIYESIHVAALRQRSRLAYGAFRGVEWLAARLSGGRILSHATDFCLVATRPSA